jgi:heme/copper-type cytochrome/quinol oxidase subunit 2
LTRGMTSVAISPIVHQGSEEGETVGNVLRLLNYGGFGEMDTPKVYLASAVVASLAATGLLLAAGCQSTPAEKPRAQEQQQAQVVKVDSDGVQRVRVVAGSYFFKPNHLVVKVNTPVEILASREAGMTPHDLVIKAQDAGIDVERDLTTEVLRVVFTPKKTGKYAIYCSKKPPFGGAAHRERGMEGILEVVP